MKTIRINKKYRRTNYNGYWTPKLIMEGHQLKNAGFKINTECSVLIENGKITITAS
jgi:hypothetical protein